MICEIITIGDEILIGQIVDTNSAWLAVKLNDLGIKIVQITSVQDEESHIIQSLKDAENRADLILITGGLGPTKDDITKVAVAKYFNCTLKINDLALADVSDYFQRRGASLSETNKTQAILPSLAVPVKNELGTAPAMWFEKKNNDFSKYFLFLPGVPYEMKSIMEKKGLSLIAEKLKESGSTKIILHKNVLCCGIGESFLSDKIKPIEDKLPSYIKLAYLPSTGIVKLRFSATGSDRSFLKNEVNIVIEELKKIIGNFIFGYDNDTLEKKIGEELLSKKYTLSLAESCTGGYLSHLITSVPGSSRYFSGSVVSYSNKVKSHQLNIPEEIINTYGAVSEEVVRLMAENVRKIYKSDVSLAVSGIAGPDGGTIEKPVGMVWIGFSDNKKTISKKLQFNQDRIRNIQLSSVTALNLLRKNM